MAKPTLNDIYSVMTDKQAYRLCLRLRGLKLKEIAEIEGVSITSVWQSLAGGGKRAEKKYKFYRNILKTY